MRDLNWALRGFGAPHFFDAYLGLAVGRKARVRKLFAVEIPKPQKARLQEDTIPIQQPLEAGRGRRKVTVADADVAMPGEGMRYAAKQ